MVPRTVLGLALAVALISIAPDPAVACTCGTPEEGRANADMAFIGVVAGHVGKPISPYYNTGDPVTYTFAIETALRGRPDPAVQILSAIEGSACGIPMDIGQRWSIYASLWEGDYWASSCSGSTLLATDVSVPPVPAVTGTVPLYPLPVSYLVLLILVTSALVIALLLAFSALDRRFSQGRRGRTGGTGSGLGPG